MRQNFYALVSIPVYGILYCYTTAGVIIVLILTLLHLKKPIAFMFYIWAKSIFFIIGKKFKITGKENIHKNKRYILVANHASLFDIVAIMSFYRGISWFGHERLLRIPFFGMILKMIDFVPFKEPNYRNTKKMIGQLAQKAENKTVAIFPEGTRTLNGKINEFYRGFIWLFRTRDIEILPITLNGFYQLKPKNRFYINFEAKLSVVIHKSISREELINKSDNEIIETVKSVIESAYQ
jgi:1-acyl-sn-glycerol-3-phosphate acyltransferase